jgi:hypothetical protein
MTSNFDFFKELNKIHPIKNIVTSTSLNSSVETCLISKLPLEKNYISLPCTHKFNYFSLYKELIIQKKHKNYLNTVKLNSGEIKCPYCRSISKKLIPYIPLEGVKKIYGINHPLEYCMDHIPCAWIFKTGKRKNTVCNTNGYHSDFGKYCPTHYKYMKKEKPQEKNTSSCSAILKTGKRKGQLCNCKALINNLCGRHRK